jgi:hypothetical protein
MKSKTSRFFSVPAIAIAMALSACGGGGGGGGDSSIAATPTTTISGAVAGTTIIAVDSSGDIVATADTAGRTRDVDTDSDGIFDAFSFNLTGIPLAEDIRIYLVSGGGIYPMYFDTDNDGVSDSNVFALTADTGGAIALGFINVTDEIGRAIPSINPAETDGVSGSGELASIPATVNQPPTANLSVAELNTKGNDALASGWVLGAKTYYQAAVNLAGSNADNDADTARFMLALTRVAALGFDTLSDGNTQDMDRLGDLLDLFGVEDGPGRANWELMVTPDTLNDNSPTGNEVRDFFYNVVKPELQAAVANLDAVSSSFESTLTDSFDQNSLLEVDKGDALFFAGLFNSMLAEMAIQRAYNLDGDIDNPFNNEANNDPALDPSIESFLNANQDFLKLADATKLAEAKASVSAALGDMDGAIDSILAETDDQTDDMITIDATVNTVEIKTWISETQASINGDSPNIGQVALNLQLFFDNGVDIRNQLPTFSGNNASSNFIDPTAGGVIDDTVAIDLNEDSNADGIPDIAQ